MSTDPKLKYTAFFKIQASSLSLYVVNFFPPSGSVDSQQHFKTKKICYYPHRCHKKELSFDYGTTFAFFRCALDFSLVTWCYGDIVEIKSATKQN